MQDWLLEMLIEIVEATESKGPDRGGFPVTLCVGGTLVSGRIISSKLYLQLFANGTVHEIVQKAVAAGKLAQPAQDDSSEDDSPGFIHLASARFSFGAHDPIPTAGEGILWRCRLDRVDGFHIGQIAVPHGGVDTGDVV